MRALLIGRPPGHRTSISNNRRRRTPPLLSPATCFWIVLAFSSTGARAQPQQPFVPAVLRGNHYTQPIFFTPAPTVPDTPSKCSGSFVGGGPCALSFRLPSFGAMSSELPVSTGVASGWPDGERTAVTIRCSPQLARFERSPSDQYFFFFMHSDGTAEVFAVAHAGPALSSNNRALIRVGDPATWGSAADLTDLAYGARVFPIRDYLIYFTKRSVYMSLNVALGSLFPGSTDVTVPRVACGMQRDLVLYSQTNVLPVSFYAPKCRRSWLYGPTGVCGPRLSRTVSCAASSWIFVGSERGTELPRFTLAYWRTYSRDVPILVASGSFVEHMLRGVTFTWSETEGVRVLVSRSFFDVFNDGVVEGVISVAFGNTVHQYRMACDRLDVGRYHTTGPIELYDEDPYANDEPFPDPTPVSVVVDEAHSVYCVRDAVFVSCPVGASKSKEASFTLWTELNGVRSLMARVFYAGNGVYDELGDGLQLLASKRILGPRRVSYTPEFVSGRDFQTYADATGVWFVVLTGKDYFDPWRELSYGCDYNDGGETSSYRYRVTIGDPTLSTCAPRCAPTWAAFLGRCVPQDASKVSVEVVSCTGGLILDCPQNAVSPSDSVYWYYVSGAGTGATSRNPTYIGSSVSGVNDVVDGVESREGGSVFVTNDYIRKVLNSNARGTFEGLCGLKQVVYNIRVPICVSVVTLPPWALFFTTTVRPPVPIFTLGPAVPVKPTIAPQQQPSAPLKNQGSLAAIVLFTLFSIVCILVLCVLVYHFISKILFRDEVDYDIMDK
ncbi:membrane protein ORF115 [Cyprinid herpesvirus 3]|nr:membrane protein ORF115 [Cyprinid herpesvirus 3]